MEIPPDIQALARCFVESDDHATKQQIHFRQLRAMARKAGEQLDRLVEFRADCEAELAAAMRPGQRVEFGDVVLVRSVVDGIPVVVIENALEEATLG